MMHLDFCILWITITSALLYMNPQMIFSGLFMVSFNAFSTEVRGIESTRTVTTEASTLESTTAANIFAAVHGLDIAARMLLKIRLPFTSGLSWVFSPNNWKNGVSGISTASICDISWLNNSTAASFMNFNTTLRC